MKLSTPDLTCKEVNARIQAILLKLNSDDPVLTMGSGIDSSVWNAAYRKFTVTTKKMLLANVTKIINSGHMYHTEYPKMVYECMSSLLNDMQMKPDLADPAPLTGLTALAISTRRTMAKNTKTKVDVLMQLLNDEDAATRHRALENKSLPLSYLEQQLATVVAKETANPDDYFRPSSSDIRRLMLKRNDISSAFLLECMIPDDWYTRKAVVNHPLLTDADILELSKHTDPDIREVIASSPRATPEILRSLSTDPDEDVRRIVAANATDQGVLKILSTDPAMEVRNATAYNLATPVALLKVMKHDADASVSQAAAYSWSHRRKP